ncbi:MAG: nucleoside triphosphate pyrophosphohydrolase [Nanoarchaeota archaeon]
MKYNKLVRDKIPEIIKSKEEKCSTHIANNEEYWNKLKEKLLEEVNEFIKSENREELADILEVLDAIYEFKNYKKEEIEQIKKEKAINKGQFKNRIILEEITTIFK